MITKLKRVQRNGSLFCKDISKTYALYLKFAFYNMFLSANDIYHKIWIRRIMTRLPQKFLGRIKLLAQI